MDIKILLLGMLVLIVLGIVIMMLSNDMFMVLAVIFALLFVWAFISWKNSMGKVYPSPYEQVRKNFQSQALKCKPRTPGCLYLSIDGLLHFTKMGRITGVSYWTPNPTVVNVHDGKKSKMVGLYQNEDSTNDEIIKKFPKKLFGGWANLVIIAYTPDTLIWKLPVVSLLAPTYLFLAADHQLWKAENNGDIKIRGSTPRQVMFFDMADAPDLNLNYVASCINDEVGLMTLQYFMGEQIEIVAKGIRSDGIHEKFIELINKKPGFDSGIK